MQVGYEVAALRLSTRLRGVSPPVVRVLLIAEQASLAELHRVLQVAFAWRDEHPYTFLIRGWRIGDPDRAAQLAHAGDRIDYPLAAFGIEIGEAFRYQYNMSSGWEIDCRLEARALIAATELPVCLAARGDPPDEELGGPAAYPQWFVDSDSAWVIFQIEELLDEDLGDEQFRLEARRVLADARLGTQGRREITDRLRQRETIDGYTRSVHEDAGPGDSRG